MRIALIAAVARNRVIGSRNELPWSIRTDMRHFRNTTMGKPVIMGRRTFESIGQALPGRRNIVVTSDEAFAAEDVERAGSLEAAIEMARDGFDADADITADLEIMVIGGGKLYEAALPLADRLYLTQVDLEPEGDTYFPVVDMFEWREIAREDHQPETEDGPAFSIVTLERI
jgi:dihydrofolate reductase